MGRYGDSACAAAAEPLRDGLRRPAADARVAPLLDNDRRRLEPLARRAARVDAARQRQKGEIQRLAPRGRRAVAPSRASRGARTEGGRLSPHPRDRARVRRRDARAVQRKRRRMRRIALRGLRAGRQGRALLARRGLGPLSGGALDAGRRWPVVPAGGGRLHAREPRTSRGAAGWARRSAGAPEDTRQRHRQVERLPLHVLV